MSALREFKMEDFNAERIQGLDGNRGRQPCKAGARRLIGCVVSTIKI